MAEAFDLILSEYAGYTDESILDLTLARIRQMVRVISDRKRRETKDLHTLVALVAEAHAKVVGTAMTGLAQSKKSAGSMGKYLDGVDFLKLFRNEDDAKKVEKSLPSTSAVLGKLGVDPRSHLMRKK